MSGGGSQQLRIFRRAIRDGKSLEDACAATGNIIGPEEGRIYLAADAKNPPPPEAFELLYDPDAPAAASQPTKELPMATAAKQPEGDNGGEYKRPDAAKAFDIYDKQIKPKLTKIDSARGECSQPWQDIKEYANFPRQVMNFIISLDNIEDDAKRDHFLLALRDGLRHRKHFLPRDLVTMADGEEGDDLVDTEERPALKLVGIDDEPDDGAGEADPSVNDEFAEATEEELAAQEGRRGTEEAEEPEQAEVAE